MYNGLEFLDIRAIVSFALQIQNTEQLHKQATNNDVIRDIHEDIDLLDRKLDAILHLLSSHTPN